jgi:hypothetical protein
LDSKEGKRFQGFNLGDLVLMQNKAKVGLEPKWLGPFMICNLGKNHQYRLQRPNGTEWPNMVHHGLLKKFVGTDTSLRFEHDQRRSTWKRKGLIQDESNVGREVNDDTRQDET